MNAVRIRNMLVFPVLCVLLIAACKKNESMIGNKNIPITETYQPNGLKYLALGDSYTIGEGEKAEYTYPFQVEEMLEKEGFGFSTIKVIAKTGWTSSELINAVRQENIGQASFDIASLLIGVNNQYQGQTLDQFKKELIELIELTLGFLGNNNQKTLVLISIPDWGVTTFGQSAIKPQDQITKEIDAFNKVVKQEVSKYGLHFINITDSYRENGGLTENLMIDGLHPSKNIYSEWALQVSEVFKKSFN